MDAEEARVRFGILQRYVVGEVLRAFLMGLMTITIVFVLFIVMTEATRNGLTPRDIVAFVPYVVPGSLPYTVPVSLLLAVTIIYGRLAGDNEIIAIKTAGQSVWTVLWPAISIGLVVSLSLAFAARTAIPTANTLAFRTMIKSVEDGFYKFLKKERTFDRPQWPFLIQVKDLEGHTMIGATFKHRAPRPSGGRNANIDPKDFTYFDVVIQAKRANIEFDNVNHLMHIKLDGSDITQGTSKKQTSWVVNDSQIDLPLPPEFEKPLEKRIPQMTDAELEDNQKDFRDKIKFERRRQAYAASLLLASGKPDRVDWGEFQKAFIDYNFWEQKCNEFETERQMRTAMAFGGFFFVLLGAPVGIRFARRDFLSAFITCFVPVIILYYPLILGGINLSKDGIVHPVLALWAGNVVLMILALLTLRPVIKH
jgi:lipopolysaccharide export system permease protein